MPLQSHTVASDGGPTAYFNPLCLTKINPMNLGGLLHQIKSALRAVHIQKSEPMLSDQAR
jgi:hypothetical protein